MAANANTHIDIDALCVSFELRLLTQARRKTHKRLLSLRQTFSGFMCTEIVWAVLTTEHTKVTGRPPVSVLQAAAKNNKLFILFHHKPSFRVTHTDRFTKSQIFWTLCFPVTCKFTIGAILAIVLLYITTTNGGMSGDATASRWWYWCPTAIRQRASDVAWNVQPPSKVLKQSIFTITKSKWFWWFWFFCVTFVFASGLPNLKRFSVNIWWNLHIIHQHFF